MKKLLLVLILLCFWSTSFADIDTFEGTATSTLDTYEGNTNIDTIEGNTIASGTSYRFYWSCDTLPTLDTEATTSLTDASGNYKIWLSNATYPLVDVAGHDGGTGEAWGQNLAVWQNARVTRTFIPTDKATIKMYIYKDSTRSPGTTSYLIKTNDASQNNSFGLWFNNDNGYLYAKVMDGSGNYMQAAADANLIDDTWYLLECTFDVSAGTISMKLDGTSLASSTGTLSSITAWGTTFYASIGFYSDDFGRFDEIYIYNE